MPLPKLTDEQVKNLAYIKRLSVESYSLEKAINEALGYHQSQGMTLEQFKSAMLNADRSTPFDLKNAGKRTEPVFSGLKNAKKFSQKEIEDRKKLSDQAYMAYGVSKYDNLFKDTTLKYAVIEDQITEQERRELMKTRDFMKIILDPGSDEHTLKKNTAIARKMLGKNIDRTNLTEEQFKDLKDKQIAEAFNNRMQQLVSVDYSRFENMTDQQLVENWKEYSDVFDAIAVCQAEINSISKTNKYFDKELGNRCLDIENKYGKEFFYNSCRIRLIANPYYKDVDMSAFALQPLANFETIGDMEEGIQLGHLYLDLNSVENSRGELFLETIAQDFDKYEAGTTAEKLQYFDKNGNPTDYTYRVDFAHQAKTDAVFVAPEGRPDLLKAFTIDLVTNRPKEEDPAKYQDIMNQIRQTMPDKTVQWAKDDAMVRNTSVYGSILTQTTSLWEKSDLIGEAINKAKNPEEMKAAVSSVLTRTFANPRPKTTYEEFCRVAGVPKSEQLSRAAIEERRQMTEKALNAIIDFQIKGYELKEDYTKTMTDPSIRQFRTFFLKRGKGQMDYNENFIKTFTNSDSAGKKEMIMKRVSEYKTMCDEIFNRSYSDQDIIDNLDKLSEFCYGMGMEFKGTVIDPAEKWGINYTEEELAMMNDLNERAYLMNNTLFNRLSIMTTQMYQYGATERLGSPEIQGQIYANKDKGNVDLELLRSSTITMTNLYVINGERADTIKKIVNPTGKRELDYIYDNNGNSIDPNDNNEIGKAASKQGNIMFFYKDSPEPVVIKITDPDFFPPQVEGPEMTPALRSDIRAAKLNHAMQLIEKDRSMKPDMKELEQSILAKEYELGILAEDPKNRDALNEHMADYLARITIREMKKKLGPEGDNMQITEKTIKDFAKDLQKSSLVKLVSDKLLENPDSFNNLKAEDVYKTMLSQKKTADKMDIEIKHQKKQELTQKSMNTVLKNYNFFKNTLPANDASLFGLTQEIKENTAKNSKVGEMTYTRSSIQAQAIAILIDEGKPLKDILKPEMQAERERAAQQAIREAVEGNATAIAGHINNAMNKTGQELGKFFDSIKEVSVAECTKPENVHIIRLASVFKDFSQEFDKVAAHNDGVKEKFPDVKKYQDKLECPTNLLLAIKNTYQEYIGNEERVVDTDITKLGFSSNLYNNYIQQKVYNATFNAIEKLPENAGKNRSDLINLDSTEKLYSAYYPLTSTDDYQAVIRHCQQKPELLNKLTQAILDDTLADEMKLDVKIVNGAPVVKIDSKAAIKSIDARMNVNVKETLDMANGIKAPKLENKQMENKNMDGPVA